MLPLKCQGGFVFCAAVENFSLVWIPQLENSKWETFSSGWTLLSVSRVVKWVLQVLVANTPAAKPVYVLYMILLLSEVLCCPQQGRRETYNEFLIISLRQIGLMPKYKWFDLGAEINTVQLHYKRLAYVKNRFQTYILQWYYRIWKSTEKLALFLDLSFFP